MKKSSCPKISFFFYKRPMYLAPTTWSAWQRPRSGAHKGGTNPAQREPIAAPASSAARIRKPKGSK